MRFRNLEVGNHLQYYYDSKTDDESRVWARGLATNLTKIEGLKY